MEETKYAILYCACENLCDYILLRFRFWFRNTVQKLLDLARYAVPFLTDKA
jgi:hypothetical protein